MRCIVIAALVLTEICTKKNVDFIEVGLLFITFFAPAHTVMYCSENLCGKTADSVITECNGPFSLSLYIQFNAVRSGHDYSTA